jgi:hypothetical protein
VPRVVDGGRQSRPGSTTRRHEPNHSPRLDASQRMRAHRLGEASGAICVTDQMGLGSGFDPAEALPAVDGCRWRVMAAADHPHLRQERRLSHEFVRSPTEISPPNQPFHRITHDLAAPDPGGSRDAVGFVRVVGLRWELGRPGRLESLADTLRGLRTGCALSAGPTGCPPCDGGGRRCDGRGWGTGVRRPSRFGGLRGFWAWLRRGFLSRFR